MTASSSKEGEFATSTTTLVSIRASASPSPVMVLTPEAGDAATTSWSFSRSLLTRFVPMRPLPPITTAFMSGPPANGVFDRLEDDGSAGKRPCSGLELQLSFASVYAQEVQDRKSGAVGKRVSDGGGLGGGRI